MIDQTLRERVIQRVLAVCDVPVDPAKLTEAISLRQDLDIASMNLISLAAELEDELGIMIDDEELSEIQTLGDLFGVIQRHKASSGSV